MVNSRIHFKKHLFTLKIRLFSTFTCLNSPLNNNQDSERSNDQLANVPDNSSQEIDFENTTVQSKIQVINKYLLPKKEERAYSDDEYSSDSTTGSDLDQEFRNDKDRMDDYYRAKHGNLVVQRSRANEANDSLYQEGHISSAEHEENQKNILAKGEDKEQALRDREIENKSEKSESSEGDSYLSDVEMKDLNVADSDDDDSDNNGGSGGPGGFTFGGKGSSESENPSPYIGNTTNASISPLDFVIELESCTSIFDVGSLYDVSEI